MSQCAFRINSFPLSCPSGTCCWGTTCSRSSQAPGRSTFRYKLFSLSFFTQQPSVKRHRGASCFVARGPPGVSVLTSCARVCQRSAADVWQGLGVWQQGICFCWKKQKCTTVRGGHDDGFLAREPPSSGRTAASDSRGHIRWEVAQRDLANTCNLFLSVQEKKKEALTNINQQENETKKCSVQFKCSVDISFFAFGVNFRAIYKIQSTPTPQKKSVLICCELDVINIWFTGLDFDTYVYVAVKSAAFTSERFLSLSQSFTAFLKGTWTLQVRLSLMEVINYWSLLFSTTLCCGGILG